MFQFERFRVEMAVRSDLQKQVARVAIAHGATDRLEVLFDEVIDHIGTKRDFCDSAHDLEKFAESLFCWILDFDLVRNSTQKRVVDKVFWLEIGAEDDQLIEWDLNFLSVAHRQVVVAFFERYDPSIEQFVDTHSLTSEVVDQQNAAIAFELQRRIANIGIFIEVNLQHFHGQFTAGDNGRSANSNPSIVDRAIFEHSIRLFVGAFLVIEWVENP